jgi:hypothetical protein
VTCLTFPNPGIPFRGFAPPFGNVRPFAALVDVMAEPFLGKIDRGSESSRAASSSARRWPNGSASD